MKFSILSSAMLCAMLIFAGCSEEDSGNEQMVRALAMAKNGDWQGAEAIADNLSEELPGAVAPLLLKVIAYERAGEMNKAIDLALQCARNNPNDFTAQYMLGRLYAMDPKRDAEAFEILERAIQLRAGDLNTLILLCNLGVKRNEPNTGRYLEQLLSKTRLTNSEKAQVYYMQGVYFHKNGNTVQALSSMDQASNLSRENPELLLQIARFTDNLGAYGNEAGFLYRRFVILYERTANPDPAKLQEARRREQQLLGSQR